MFLPVVLCGSVRASAAAAFSPTQLSGYVNSPYNIALLRSQGKLWQDTAMTVAAVADGDPVRRIDCGGTYYDAPSDAARPLLYSEGSGKWSLSFDGVDDRVTNANMSAFSGVSCATTGVSLYCGTAGNQVIISPVSGAGQIQAMYDYWVFYPKQGTHGSVQVAATYRKYRVINRYDGSQVGDAARLRGYIDGVAQTLAFSNPPVPATADSGNGVAIGDTIGGAAPADGRFYGLVLVGATVTDDQITALDTYLAALAP